MTSTFNANVESAVFNDGYTTNLFKLSKGVRQGCRLSPFLFILSARLLFIKIRHDPGVKGNHPLDMKWMQTPVMILGAHFSYDKEENDDSDFSLKLRKLQTKLDMWSARGLTLFGSLDNHNSRYFTDHVFRLKF